MKVEFKNSFLKDLKKLKNKSLQNSIYNCILQIESAPNVSSIKNIKKLKGFEIHYRIKIGDYRIGVKLEDELIYLVVFEHRKDIYKYFP